MSVRAGFVVAWALLAVGCGPGKGKAADDSATDAVLIVDAEGERDVDVRDVRVTGSGVRSVTRSNDTLMVRVDLARAGDLRVTAAGACPVVVASKELEAGRSLRKKAEPLLSFPPPLPQVGYGARFTIAVKPNCPEAPEELVWEQQEGPPLEAVEAGPLTFSATLPGAVAMLGESPAWGIVPVSARTRGAVLVAATWRDASGTTRWRGVPVSAASRSRGLPNVAMGARLYLGGEGWRVLSRPSGSTADIAATTPHDGRALQAFIPDARGAFVLEDREHHALRLVAGRYDETPLDCGRSECHRAIAETSRSSPMQTVFARGVGARFGDDYPACALGCHTTGETGLDDGGFAAIAALLGRTPRSLAEGGYHDMPPALRRSAGVGCLACHGPGTVPEPEGRWALLARGVCATCHDAPPRYGHVLAYETSKMAHADADTRTQAEPCARCHTTWGFLDQPERRPPAHVRGTGIGCVACHAVHPEHEDTRAGHTCAAALPREVPVPALLEGRVPAGATKSRVCLPCHTPDAKDGEAPAASAAALWLGRGGLDPVTGAPLEGAIVHGSVEGGCIGCHRGGPGGLGKGSSHGFANDAGVCASCHTERKDDALRRRAIALHDRLAGVAAPKAAPELERRLLPGHSRPERVDRSTPRGRARHNLLLVIEDGGADAHNAPYARALLDSVERLLEVGKQ